MSSGRRKTERMRERERIVRNPEYSGRDRRERMKVDGKTGIVTGNTKLQ
jgi:hypothetical protein